jgi:M6 family metalloprotease-like protein
MKKIGGFAAIILTILLLVPVAVVAMPASPDIVEVGQPGKASVKVYLKGDEWNNWVETPAGFTIAEGPEGYWHYVTGYNGKQPTLSPALADETPPAGLMRQLRPALDDVMARVTGISGSLDKAPYGTFNGKILFILARFNDRAGTYPAASFASFISNNIKDYFSKASYGKVTLSPAEETFGTVNDGVVGWVNLGYNHPNPGAATGISNQTIVKKAIWKASPYVNFAAFDTNGDGYVDSDELAIVVIVAGFERSYSTYAPSVWGHRWSLDGIGAPTVDGVIVGADHGGKGGYAQFGEIHQSSTTDKHKATMGIMVHELGHLIFGLPDLYDTDYSSSGVGAFCVMSGGSWGKATIDTYSGQRPVLPSAWIKFNRGWVDAESVGDVNRSIRAAGSLVTNSSNAVFRKMTPVTGEYFMAENRRPLGYDLGLQKWLGDSFGGIAIWHVDENQANNADDAHRKVDLEVADGVAMGTGPGSATKLWYVGNSTSFNNSSTPNSKTYDGKKSCISIIAKSAPSLTMVANFKMQAGCCTPQTCGYFTGDCDPSVSPCYCFKQPSGLGKCVDNFMCSSATACTTDTDCPAGRACYSETCCGSPVCGPTTCTGTTQGGPSLIPGEPTATSCFNN